MKSKLKFQKLDDIITETLLNFVVVFGITYFTLAQTGVDLINALKPAFVLAGLNFFRKLEKEFKIKKSKKIKTYKNKIKYMFSKIELFRII